MRTSLFISLIVAVILVSGCLRNIAPNYNSEYANSMKKYTVYDEGLIQECKLGHCVCMTCKNSSSIFPTIYKSMVGGSCRFVHECNNTVFTELLNATQPERLRPFMIGQGYSISSFADANEYCAGKLNMAVHWLVGDNDTPYQLPRADRTMCLIDREVLPVYVLYSNGTNINATRAGEIAKILGSEGPKNPLLSMAGQVGPVVITTEIDFNSSDQAAVDAVKRQIQEINAGCNNRRPNDIFCFVALAPKMGDKEGVAKVLDEQDIRDGVDLIAFGLNAHTVNLNDSYKPFCEPGDVYSIALDFARFSLYNYSKPTIIPYILFDSAGPDASGKCNWTEAAMIDGYTNFFTGLGAYVYTFKSLGVIGAAPYDFNSSQYAISSPLSCIDCSLGKNTQRMEAWFSGCRAYKKKVNDTGFGDNFVLFGNESGSSCDHFANLAGILSTMTGNTATGTPPPLAPPKKTFMRCDACLNDNITFPFKVATCTPSQTQTYCTDYREIEFFSDKRSLDPMLVRAVAYKEGSFKNCTASTLPCGSSQNKAYDFVRDPDGICNDFETKKPGTRYCGLGFMQVLTPPFTYWPGQFNPDNPGEDGIYYDGSPNDNLYKQAKEAGRSDEVEAAISECSPKFNPFNVTHAVCLGTYMLEKGYKNGMATAIANADKLEASGDQNKLRILAYYFALDAYYGTSGNIPGWIENFKNRKNLDQQTCINNGIDPADKCCGNKDFINYVRTCEYKQPDSGCNWASGDQDYGWKVLSYYRGLVSSCPNAGCPSCSKLASTLNQDNPSGFVLPASGCTPPPMLPQPPVIATPPITPRIP